jgi:hypothetical protein
MAQNGSNVWEVCSSVQFSSVLYNKHKTNSTDATGRDGKYKNSINNELAYKGVIKITERNGTVRNGTERNGTEQNRTE